MELETLENGIGNIGKFNLGTLENSIENIGKLHWKIEMEIGNIGYKYIIVTIPGQFSNISLIFQYILLAPTQFCSGASYLPLQGLARSQDDFSLHTLNYAILVLPDADEPSEERDVGYGD